jgi:lambda family phage tail tape measure protein
LADNEVKLIINAIDNTTTAFNNLNNNLKNMSTQVAEGITKFAELAVTVYETLEKTKEFITEGYKAVDEFNMSVLRTATVLTQLKASQDKNLDTKEYYNQAKEYAEGQQEIAEQVASKSIASLKNIEKEMFIINEHGITISASKESIDSLVALSNAIEIVSFTARSSLKTLKAETEGLLDADIKKSQLAKQINESMGGDDNHNVLAETIRMWESQGRDVMVELAKYMQGYNASAKDYEGTWAVIENHLSTIKDEMMRLGFKEVYQDVNNLLVGIIKYVEQHKQQISEGIKGAWIEVKGVLWFIGELIKLIAMEIKGWQIIFDLIARGLLYISDGILPYIAEKLRILKLLASEFLSVLTSGAKTIAYTLSFQWGKASEQAKETVKEADKFSKIMKMAVDTSSFSQRMKYVATLIKEANEREKKGSEKAETPTDFKSPKHVHHFTDSDKAKGGGDLDSLRDSYNALMDELYSATQVGIAKDLADTDKWLTEKLKKIKEFQKKGVISSQEALNAINLAQQGASTKDDKIIEDYHKKRVDLERDITKEFQTEYDKRLAEAQDWGDKETEKLDEIYKNNHFDQIVYDKLLKLNVKEAELYKQDAMTYEQYQDDKIKIEEATAQKKQKVEQDYQNKIAELKIQNALAQIDLDVKLQNESQKDALNEQIDLNMRLLDVYKQEAKQFRDAGDDQNYIQKMEQIKRLESSIVDLKLKWLELNGTIGQGFQFAMKEFSDKALSSFQQGKEIANSLISTMQNGLTSFLDVTSAKFMNFRDLAISTLQSIYQELLKILVIQPLVSSLGGLLGGGGGLFGGLFGGGALEPASPNIGMLSGLHFHTGGYVPRFHLGIDEVPAILQTGERVLSREQNNTFNKLASALDNPAPAKQQQSVNIVNVIDPQLLNQYLSSQAGQKAVINVISNQSAQIKKVLR